MTIPRASRLALRALVAGTATLALPAACAWAADPLLEAKSSHATSIEQRLAAGGTVRVIVRHRAPIRPESYSAGPGGLESVQSAVASVQGNLVAALTAGDTARAERMAIRTMSHLPLIAMTVNQAELRAMIADGRVEQVWEDRLSPPTLTDSVPLVFGAAPAAPAATPGKAPGKAPLGKGAIVAVLDTGVDTRHPFFGGRVTHEACFSTTDPQSRSRSLCPNNRGSQVGKGSACPANPTGDLCVHGTHVAGIAAGKNAPGPVPARGVAPEAHIFSIQVFSQFDNPQDCGGRAPCLLSFTSDQIAGLNHLLSQGTLADGVLAAANMSLGGGPAQRTPCATDTLVPAIVALRARGVATVISSGNDGFIDAVSSPACIAAAVTVGSTTKADAVSSFSNISTGVDVLAPGTAILSAVPHGKFDSFNGTSMAAPHVAGTFAVIRSAFPKATVDQIEAALKATGRPVRDARPGGTLTLPRIQVERALLALQTGLPAPAATPAPAPAAPTPAPPVAAVPPAPVPAAAPATPGPAPSAAPAAPTPPIATVPPAAGPAPSPAVAAPPPAPTPAAAPAAPIPAPVAVTPVPAPPVPPAPAPASVPAPPPPTAPVAATPPPAPAPAPAAAPTPAPVAAPAPPAPVAPPAAPVAPVMPAPAATPPPAAPAAECDMNLILREDATKGPTSCK